MFIYDKNSWMAIIILEYISRGYEYKIILLVPDASRVRFN